MVGRLWEQPPSAQGCLSELLPTKPLGRLQLTLLLSGLWLTDQKLAARVWRLRHPQKLGPLGCCWGRTQLLAAAEHRHVIIT